MATINATTSQGGYLSNEKDSATYTWDDARITNPADSATVNGTYIYTRAGLVSGSKSTDYICSRGYLVFDTSAIVGTVTALSLNIYVHAVLDTNYTPQAIADAVLSPNISTALTTSDWAPYSYGAVSSGFSSTGGEWKVVTLDGTAMSLAASNNDLILRLRDVYYDYDYPTNTTDPVADGYMQYRYNYSSFIPYLEYTEYTGYGKTVNGIVAANFQNINGLSKMSIYKVLGV